MNLLSKTLGRLASVALVLSVMQISAPALASTGGDLKQLLNQVRQDRITESKINTAREAAFRAEKDERAALLATAKTELAAQQERAATLESAYETNDVRLTEQKDMLERRKGTLGEMFGLVRQTASDLQGSFSTSLISAQYPERTTLLSKLAGSTALPSVSELEALWIEIYQAMTVSGQVTTFPATIVHGEGNETQAEVLRVGPFNAVADGRYLNYVPETGKFEELSRQPDRRILETASSIASASGYTPFYIDPSRGAILSLLAQTPSVKERINQGGPVGYVILAIGVAGLILALYSWIRLTGIGRRIRSQLKSDTVIAGNPMGEVLAVYQNNKNADVETLELKLDEVIIKQAPKLERGIGFIKLFASVAHLLGLLGTVIGMIATFQAITLFGTGDPKLMAGGISEALVTTMLGLVVAVPLIFAHTIVNGRSRRLIQILEEQSAGFIARHKEDEMSGVR